MQILKWHRDIYFNGKDDKPISIIITTLAAQSYRNEGDLLMSLTNIVNSMLDINNVISDDGKYYIPKPVNLDENFADKWNENPALPLVFFKWLEQLKVDFATASCQRDIFKAGELLSLAFGKDVIERSMEKYDVIEKKPAKVYPEITFSAKPNKPWAK